MAKDPFDDLPEYPPGPRRPYKPAVARTVDFSRTNDDLDPSSPLYEMRQSIRAEQDEREDRKASRSVLGEMKRQRQTEADVYERARRGEKVDVEDPGLREVAQAGEQSHRQDRRVSFLTGLGQGLNAISRGMPQPRRRTPTGFNGRRRTAAPSALSKAAKRRF